jgi:hypothetical protein
MESYRKAKDEIIKPPRQYYIDEYDLPFELSSLEGEVYERHDYEIFSYNQKV